MSAEAVVTASGDRDPGSLVATDAGRDLDRQAHRLLALRNLLTPMLTLAAGALGALATMTGRGPVLALVSAAVFTGGFAWGLSVRRARRCLDELGRLARGPAAVEIDLVAMERDGELAEWRQRVQAVLNAGESMEMAYQPIVELGTGDVVGHEALARFAGGRAPDEWFAEAHAVGMGAELEMLAISNALRHRPRSGYLSVNVSPATLVSQAFGDFLHERSVPGLVVELTEHVGIDDYDGLTDVLALLHRRGAHLAVDDAGSGYASMLHVLKLRPEIIKLDRSLVANLDRDPARQELVRSLSAFASRTGASIVAEGIERSREAEICHEVGVEFGQGYLFCPPTSPGVDRAIPFLR